MSYELLQEAFGAIQFKGTYGVTGRVFETYKLPRINVKGVGRLSWPIAEYQTEQLKNIMEKPQHRKGNMNEIEKPPYIDGNKIEIDNSFDHVKEIITNQLALEEYEIEITLNKLILYEEGVGYDWKQESSEKSNGKFGSLIIHLPSYYEGGELLIQHERTQINTIYNQQEREDEFFYSAFYSDCHQKLNPITKGHKFTLLFDLIMKNSSNQMNLSIIHANKKAKNILDHFIHTIVHGKSDNNKKPRFLFPLDHIYSDKNCNLQLKGKDREKLSLLQNMKDENGNDLFFITIGNGLRKNIRRSEDIFRHKTDQIEFCYLSHSLCNKPANFKLLLTNEEGKLIFTNLCKSKYGKVATNTYNNSFAMIWLTDHHFSIVSEYYDITNDICKIIKSNPTYGEKYLDQLITEGKNFENALCKSTFQLRDKERFLQAISCGPPRSDSENYCKIISDSIETELVTWNEIIPLIARFMGNFDENKVKLFSDIKDEKIKLNFFNEIKKSAKLESKGLFNWIDFHNQVNCSIDYIFEKIDPEDDRSNIEFFIYCFDHQLLQKALEYGRCLSKRLDSVYDKTNKKFYEIIISKFLELNDNQCFIKLCEFLLPRQNRFTTFFLEATPWDFILLWGTINSNLEQTNVLIPYFFDYLKEQQRTCNLCQSSLFSLFNIMIKSDEKKIFISPKYFYVLLFNRINIDEFYTNEAINKKLFFNKLMQMGDKSNHKSFVKYMIDKKNYSFPFLHCNVTPSFANVFCDDFLNRHESFCDMEFMEICFWLIARNMDDKRLKNLLDVCLEMQIENVIEIFDAIINCGRGNDCDLASVFADYLMNVKLNSNPVIYPFLVKIICNNDLGGKFLHAIDNLIGNKPDLLKKKAIFVDIFLFNSNLQVRCNIFNYSSEFLRRIETLISFEINYLNTNKLGSYVYPDSLLPKQTLREGILEFLKQDREFLIIGDSGEFPTLTQAKNEADLVIRCIPHIEVDVEEGENYSRYVIFKQKVFPDTDKTDKKIQQLTSMLAFITSNNVELNNFGLPNRSARAPREDEPPMKQIKKLDD